MSAFCLSYQKKIGKKKEKKSECFSILFCHSSSCLSMEVYHSTRRDKQNQNLFPTANFHCKVSFVNWPEIRMKTEIAIHILVFHFFFFVSSSSYKISEYSPYSLWLWNFKLLHWTFLSFLINSFKRSFKEMCCTIMNKKDI